MSGLSASLEVDQAQVNRLLLELVRVGETHGIRFPREFGLFIKQLLYFDRYTRILAPQLNLLQDDRVVWRASGAGSNSSSSGGGGRQPRSSTGTGSSGRVVMPEVTPPLSMG
jgi:hypothetical protein